MNVRTDPISNYSFELLDGDRREACYNDVMLGLLDSCFGGTWGTELAYLSDMYVNDNLVLITEIKTQDGLLVRMQLITEPFTWQLWAAILAISLLVGASLYFFGDVEAKNPISGIYHGMKKAFMTRGLEEEELHPLSLPGKIVVAAFGVLLLIVTSVYVANLASFIIIDNFHQPIKSVDDAVAANAKICMNQDLHGIFASKYPQSEGLIVDLTSTKHVVPYMNEGLCQCGLVSHDKYYVYMRAQTGRYEGEDNCHYAKIPNEAALSMPKSIPLGVDYVLPFNWWLGKKLRDGTIYEILRRYPAPKDVCNQDSNQSSSTQQLGPQDLVLVFGLVGISFLLGLIAFIFVRHYS